MWNYVDRMGRNTNVSTIHPLPLQQHTEVRWDPWDETHRIPTAELVSSA